MKIFPFRLFHCLISISKKTGTKWIASAICGFIIVLYLVLTLSAPIREYKTLSNLAFSDSIFISQLSQYTPEQNSLLKEKAFKEAQLLLADCDSIGLIINLHDSIAMLVVNGVTIHNAIIFRYRIDEILQNLEMPVYYKLFSQPQTVIHERSTIVKEPIVVKHAPKDTIEAAKMIYMPDTLEKEPAFISFTFASELKIVIEQNKRTSGKERRARLAFFCTEFLTDFKANLQQLFSFNLPQYSPVIKVALEGDDVRAIYRALPSETKIGLTF